jgi:cytochrome P450
VTTELESAIKEHLDAERIRELFNLQGPLYESRGGSFAGDVYGPLAALREERGPVVEGVFGPLVGYDGPGSFQGLPEPDRPHFSALDFATCDEVARDAEHYGSSPGKEQLPAALADNILYMDGERHHRYRALVQPSFVPKKAQWWIDNWVQATVDALVDNLLARDEPRADLNLDLFAAIPLLTICGSMSTTVPEALDIRTAVTSDGLGLDTFIDVVAPIIERRRGEPADDLVTVLCQAELKNEDGSVYALNDDEILGFMFLLLAAGSGTTWKQMGITATALLTHPEWLDRVRDDRTLLRPAIEESVRWQPTDPMFSRYALSDTTLGGVDIPEGAVVHMAFGAANRDPSRWDTPDTFDPGRPLKSHLGFGGGHHVCLGMHVARAEIATVTDAYLDRLPGLRIDPDAEPPQITGVYERGPRSVNVVWDA